MKEIPNPSLETITKFVNLLKKLSKVNLKNSFDLNSVLPEINEYSNMSILLGENLIKIAYFKPQVFVFKSLQAPKLLSFVSESGTLHRIIIKQNDDLRRDCRMMSLFRQLNQLLHKGEIITYGVLPFNGSSGLLEFVDGVFVLKSLMFYDRNELEYFYKKTENKMIGKHFEEAVNHFKPVLRSSMYKMFPTPEKFFKAQIKFTESYAVMCAVGWLIGLGDRHLENIAISGKCGSVMHVDLNLICDLGKKQSIPERVPFRLTNNIIHAFGPLKLEGPFINTFKETLRIIYKHKDLILANLLSFAHDPMGKLDFSGKKESKTIDRLSALEMIKGRVEIANKIYKELIKEATDPENLRRMYIGWHSFL